MCGGIVAHVSSTLAVGANWRAQVALWPISRVNVVLRRGAVSETGGTRFIAYPYFPLLASPTSMSRLRVGSHETRHRCAAREEFGVRRSKRTSRMVPACIAKARSPVDLNCMEVALQKTFSRTR